LLSVDPQIEVDQIARLTAFKERRDPRLVREALEEVQQCASSTDNLMPPIVAAVRAKVTVGEVADAMREVFGEYRESVII
jgi:methylmalonyl-CoA mutase N-terminal domain/subunit